MVCEFAYVNYEGTIVDNNHFYIDNTIYTDCNGHHDPHGNCAYAENGIDLKAGSANPNNPMIISNNKMWGFRKSDKTNSYLDDPGDAMVAHYGIYNTIIKNNVAFDSTVGLAVAAPATNEFSMADSKIVNNIFSEIKKFSFLLGDTNNILVKNNLIKGMSPINPDVWGSQYWCYIYRSKDINISNNTVLNADDRSARMFNVENLTSEDNTYFSALPGDLPSLTKDILSEDPSTKYKDLVFTTDTFTNSPRKITVSNVLK